MLQCCSQQTVTGAEQEVAATGKFAVADGAVESQNLVEYAAKDDEGPEIVPLLPPKERWGGACGLYTSELRDAILKAHTWIPEGFEPGLVFIQKKKGEAPGLIFDKKQYNGREVLAVQSASGPAKDIMPGSLIYKINDADTYDAMTEVLRGDAMLRAYLVLPMEKRKVRAKKPVAPVAAPLSDRDAILAENPWIGPDLEPSLVTITKASKDEPLGLSIFEPKQYKGRDVLAVQLAHDLTNGIMPGSLIFKVNQAETYDEMVAELKNAVSLRIYLLRGKFFTTRVEGLPDMELPLGLTLFNPTPSTPDVIVWEVKGDKGVKDGTVYWNYNTGCTAGEEVVRYDKLIRMQTGVVDTNIKKAEDVLEHLRLTQAERATGVTVLYWERPQKATTMTEQELHTWEP